MNATVKRKSLGINFDLYTRGNEEMKARLVHGMINDVKSLQECLAEAIRINSIQLLRDGIKNVNSTLTMLQHKRFLEVLEFLKFMPDSRERDVVIDSFVEQSEEILECLYWELSSF